jgi:hypothetical protein
VDASCAFDEGANLRTAKSCGPDAPTLASSSAEVSAGRRWQTSPVTGESAKETVKTIRVRERRVIPAEPVVTTLVCFFISHARLRVQLAPGVPHALCFRGEGFMLNSDASRREIAVFCRQTIRYLIARNEAKCSVSPLPLWERHRPPWRPFLEGKERRSKASAMSHR